MKYLPAFLGILAVGLASVSADEPTILFKQGDNDFGIFRAPGLVRAASGNLIVSAEGRKNPEMRWSETRPFIRVSTDGGKSWSDAAQFADAPADAKPNPIFVEKGAAEAGQIGVHNLTGTADKDGGIHWLYAVDFHRFGYDPGGRAPKAPAPVLEPGFAAARDRDLRRMNHPVSRLFRKVRRKLG